MCKVLKLGYFGEYIRSTWKVLKWCVTQEWERSVGPIASDIKKFNLQLRRRGISYIQ